MNTADINFEKTGIPLNYDHLMFEVTRECNLRCQHCMRGEPQQITMAKEIIDRVIPQIRFVSHLALTGGEPLLMPEIIEYLIDSIIENEMPLLSFTCVTNGTIIDERAIRVIQAFNRIGDYIRNLCDTYELRTLNTDFVDHKGASLSVSVSKYHNNDPAAAVAFYRQYASNNLKIERQDEWERVTPDGATKTLRELQDEVGEKLADEGRASNNGIGYRAQCCSANDKIFQNVDEMHCCITCHRIEMDNEIIKCPIQICANGNVIIESELSFAHEDQYCMGNVLTDDLSCIIAKNQWNEPLTCLEVDQLMQYQTNLDNMDLTDARQETEALRYLILLKREMLKRVHAAYPFVSLGDAQAAVESYLNVQTKGQFTPGLAVIFPTLYNADYVYNEQAELARWNDFKIYGLMSNIKHKYDKLKAER